MAQYMQLLGSDVPNSYGGCCYYGPVSHPALQTCGAAVSSLPASRTGTKASQKGDGHAHGSSLATLAAEPLSTAAAWDEVLTQLAPSSSSSASSSRVGATVPEVPEKRNERGDGAAATCAPVVNSATGAEGYLLFNCPEGTQRFSSEANIKLSKIKGFFFTRWGQNVGVVADEGNGREEETREGETHEDEDDVSNDGAGSAVMGLPGLLFTINDAGVKHANFFGPSSSLRGAQFLSHVMESKARHPDGPTPTQGRQDTPHHTHYMRLDGLAGVAPSRRTKVSSSGLERFLHVLRSHYFFYRPMTFRQITPVTLSAHWREEVRARWEAAVKAAAPCGRRGAPERDFTATFPPQDEAYPVATRMPPTPPPCESMGDGATMTERRTDPFRIIAVIPLNPHSALLAFRTSSTPPSRSLAKAASNVSEDDVMRDCHALMGAGDTSADVFSYAIVNAPPPTFDAAKARQLGVRPGPKYALLKQGIPVLADEEVILGGKKEHKADKQESKIRGGVPAATGVAEKTQRLEEQETPKRQRTEHQEEACGVRKDATPEPRLVYPHEVFRATESSKRVFISLVLDGDCVADVKHGLESLFVPATRTENAYPPAQSAFEEALCAHCPELLFFRDSEKDNDVSGGARPAGTHVMQKRAVVVHQAIHVQPESFFARKELGDAEGDARYHHYVNTVLAGVLADGAVAVSAKPTLHFSSIVEAPSPSTCVSGVGEDEVTTLHLFTSHVQRRFTAFPTALVHRFHLHLIAPRCFPGVTSTCGSASTDDDDDAGPGQFWPYSFKFKCIQESVDGAAHSNSKKNSGVGAGGGGGTKSSPAAAPASHAASLLQLHRALRNRVVSEGVSAPYIRYPTLRTARDLLSDAFLTRIAALHNSLWQGGGGVGGALGADNAGSGGGGGGGGGGGALIFTGTGSAVPSKYRNVSGTLLDIHAPAFCFGRRDCHPGDDHGACAPCKDGSASARSTTRGVFVLDFGEGSAGQLRELFRYHPTGTVAAGPAQQQQQQQQEQQQEYGGFLVHPALAEYLLDVEVVFISHGHADHHLGLLSLLTTRHRCLAQRRKTEREAPPCSATSASSPPPLAPARRSSHEKLLVVLPAEVFRFLHYTWFTTTPYCDWVYAECVFDILPSVGHSNDGPRRDAAVNTDEKEEGEEEDEEGGDDDDEAPQDEPRPVKPPSDGCREDEEDERPEGVCTANASPLSLGFPRLRALCRRWNQTIHAHAASLSSLSDSSAVQGGGVYWDADVFTVDHPANAHGVLIRFPFLILPCPPALADASVQQGSASGALLSSRVFLFSGDTRPSDALVTQCHAFCREDPVARAPTWLPPPPFSRASPPTSLANSKQAILSHPSHAKAGRAGTEKEGLFICLHEATFGPGYEADAIKKKHSTLPEALSIGARTNAAFVVLNHFSQRYPRLPGLTDEHLDGSTVDLLCKATARKREASGKDAEQLVDNTPNTDDDGKGLAPVEDLSLALHRQPRPATSAAASQNMCFAFDLMRLPFDAVQDGSVSRLLPTFVRLLEEYESWGVGTTQRLRE